jgi:predicted MFS family arabinose efflux permease
VAHAADVKLDFVGVVLGSSGLLAVVYGFSRAESDGWTDTITLVVLGMAVVFLTLFGIWISKAKNPLLPPRVVSDRDRAGSYLTILLAGLGIFGVFLFLTYFMQQNLGFSPIRTGLAFVVMPISIVTTSVTSQTRLLPRFGPRILLVVGMLFGCAGMLYLTQITATSSYLTDVMPALITFGIGFGLIFSTAINTATSGVQMSDAGIASALVNTSQQVGGAAGTALLSTIALTATKDQLLGKVPAVFSTGAASRGALQGAPMQVKQAVGEAAVHGYTVAFWASAGIFLFGAAVAGLLMRPGVPDTSGPHGGPATGAH